MKININKEQVIDGFQKASSIVPAKTGAAYLRVVWLDASDSSLKVMSTDAKLEFMGKYNGTVEETGLVGVQGKTFFDLFRKLPSGDIQLYSDPESNSLFIKQGRKKYKIPTFENSWFENFTEFPEKSPVLWSGDFLRDLIDKLAFCIADESDENMEFLKLTPVKEDKSIEACGLNGHQFAMLKFFNEDIFSLLNEDGILIAKPYLLELRRWLSTDEIMFNISDKRLFFKTKSKSEQFSFPINYDDFPNYLGFFPYFEQETSSMLVNRKELLDCMERIQLFNTETERSAYFVFDLEELIIYSQGQETGEATESINIKFSGNISKIVFPTRNLIDILNHFDSEVVKFEMTDQNGPCKITGQEDPNYLVMIMPVKVDEETFYTDEEVEEDETL